MDDYKSKLSQLDQYIRSAEWAKAHQVFREFENRKLPRTFILDFAQIARRLNKPYQILKWLYPYVRPTKIISKPPNFAEVSLYAVGLTRIGAYREAEVLLKNLPKNHPDVVQGKIQLNAYQWRYEQNIRLINSYLKMTDKSSYPYKIAEVNLLAALVYTERWKKVDEIKFSILNEAHQTLSPLLQANVLEIMAQAKIGQKQFAEALEILNTAEDILAGSQSTYAVFVQKWKMIIKILCLEAVPIQEMEKLKVMAIQNGDFETSRDLDLYKSFAQNDLALFGKLYFGTRFPSYKLKMKTLFGFKGIVKTEKKFNFQMAGDKELPTEVFFPMGLKLTPMSRKLLKILLTDFYKPIHLGEVFRELYPNEFFNPNSSRDRLYRVYLNLKKEVEKQETPISISWKNNQIGWRHTRSFILCKEEITEIKLESVHYLEKLPDRFSIHDFKNSIGKSKRTGERWIQRWLSENIIKKTKPGYFIKNSVSK